MTIIEYKLHPIPQGGMKIPDFVTDGGYWGNPDDHTLAELQARQRAIHAKYPMQIDSREDADDMNDTQVNAAIKAWVDAR